MIASNHNTNIYVLLMQDFEWAQEKINEKFIHLSVKVCLIMYDIVYNQKNKFLFEENNYYSICHNYLFKWILFLKEFNYFTWMLLNILLAWEQMDS